MRIGNLEGKALRRLRTGSLALASLEKAEVERYRRLEAKGLVIGVGIRFVSLTQLGRDVANISERSPGKTLEIVNDRGRAYLA